MQTTRSHLWRILIPLGIGTILSLTGDLTLYAVLPTYAATRAFSLASVGLLLSANRLVRLGSNPLVGLLLAGARRRGFVLAGFGLGAISTLLYVAARGTGLFLVGRLLWGISWSMINVGGYTMIMDVTTQKDRGWASGVLQGFTFAGMALDPLLGGLLSDRLSFSSALLACAALSALGFIIAMVTLPETSAGQPPSAPRLSVSLARFESSALASIRMRLSGLRALLHAQNAVANYVYFAANFVGDGILASTASLYLQTHYGSLILFGGLLLPVATAGGALLALRSGVSALVAPMAGAFSDRARGRSGSQGRWSSTAWGALLAAGGLAMIIGLRAPWALPAGITLAASGGAVIVTVSPALVREVNPGHESGTILGLLMNSADLGMALAPLVTYLLLDRLPIETIYGLAALMLVIGFILILVMRKMKILAPSIAHSGQPPKDQEPFQPVG